MLKKARRKGYHGIRGLPAKKTATRNGVMKFLVTTAVGLLSFPKMSEDSL
jgi:hypothetical protein